MEEPMTADHSGPETPTPGGEVVMEPAHSLSDVGERAKEVARQKAGEVQAGLGEARDAAARKAEATIDQAAEEVSRTARALDQAAGGMEGGTPQNLLREASRGLTRLSETMRGRSMSELVGELSAFGRRNPTAFLGAAALTGFALARFGVASESARSAEDDADRGPRTGGDYYG
jgi:hypothetical protein